MRTVVPALLCGICACAGVTVLRYQPSKPSIATAVVDHGRSTLPRPARGEATGAALSDGFPVWVVHHEDGTLSVISAVAPSPPKIANTYVRKDVATQVGRSLASWIPGVRRFYAGGILFDERGHALGYANVDVCLSECPRIEDMPLILTDLDTFTLRSNAADVEVGPLVEGQQRRRAADWLPWRRPAAREQDMRAADSPTVPRHSLIDALTLAEGHYAVVDGETVRSTHAEPRICKRTPRPGTCGACESDRLPLVGITSSPAARIHSRGWWKDPGDYRRSRRAVYVESQPGTFLVQRQGAGFQVVAGIFRGVCSGRW